MKSNYIEINEELGRVYVLGDVHGSIKELEAMLNYLVKKESLTESDQVIFVGDYIDRGYETKKVVDTLVDFRRQYPATVFLKGNHEDMLMDFLGFGGMLGNNFIQNGGLQTLLSYGIEEVATPDEVMEIFPDEHLAFFKNLGHLAISQNHIVVHAGLNPLRDLDSQSTEDLFWIRDEFIMNTHSFDRTVVFGHTPFKDLLFHLPYKIGIDTGLVYGNVFTCIELKEQRVLQVRAGKKRVKASKFKNHA